MRARFLALLLCGAIAPIVIANMICVQTSALTLVGMAEPRSFHFVEDIEIFDISEYYDPCLSLKNVIPLPRFYFIRSELGASIRAGHYSHIAGKLL